MPFAYSFQAELAGMVVLRRQANRRRRSGGKG